MSIAMFVRPLMVLLVGGFLGMWYYLKYRSVALRTDASRSRTLFCDLPAVKPARLVNHSHPRSAADRNSAVAFADMLCGMLGLEPYMHQKSLSDVRADKAGSRVPFWRRDLAIPAAPFRPQQNHMLVDIDTSYYLDNDEISKLVNATANPVLFSTFVPSAAACCDGEFSFRFEANRLLYQVSGGAVYESPAHDWSPDVLTFRTFSWWSGWTTTVCNVDRRPLGNSQHHQLVLLSPMWRHKGFAFMWHLSWFRPREVSGRWLERMRPCSAGIVLLKVQTRDGLKYSIAREGGYTAVTLDARQYELAAALCRLQPGKVSTGIMKSSVVGLDGEEISMAEAALLVELFRTPNPFPGAPITPAVECVARFQLGREYDFDATPGIKGFMSPVVTGATTADSSESNTEGAVAGRIEDVRNTETEVDVKLVRRMREFVALVSARHAGKLHPASREEVAARRTRPTQVVMDRREDTATKRRPGAKSFVKKEAYAGVVDPRMIQPLYSGVTVDYARFIYPLEAVFRAAPWYSPGKTPREIAESVARILKNAKCALMGDFARMDGRIGIIARLLWQMFMLAVYASAHHEALAENMRAQFATFARASNKTRYFSGFARLSGSMETTDANSLLTAFVCWLCLVEQGVDSATALTHFVVNGDDSVVAGGSVRSMEYASGCVGMVVECNVVPRFSLGVNYLNRWYGPGIFAFDLSSMVDLARALPKFGAAPAFPPNVTAADKAADKAFSYSLSDGQTPIMGAFVRKIIEQLGRPKLRLGLGPYGGDTYPRDEQYPNDYAPWMDTYAARMLPGFDYDCFDQWVKAGEALSPPVCGTVPVTIKRSGFLDGRYVEGNPYKQNDVYANADARKQAQVIADNLCAMRQAHFDVIQAAADEDRVTFDVSPEEATEPFEFLNAPPPLVGGLATHPWLTSANAAVPQQEPVQQLPIDMMVAAFLGMFAPLGFWARLWLCRKQWLGIPLVEEGVKLCIWIVGSHVHSALAGAAYGCWEMHQYMGLFGETGYSRLAALFLHFGIAVCTFYYVELGYCWRYGALAHVVFNAAGTAAACVGWLPFIFRFPGQPVRRVYV